MPRKDANRGREEEAAERRLHAFELHKRGASYRQIGAELHVSEKTAHQDVHRVLAGLAALEQASAEEYRVMEDERLDMAQLALWPRVRTGDVGAINAWIRLSESRRRLWGIDLQTPLVMEQPYVLSGPERIARLIEL